jgi:hypothetical protein
MASEHSEKLARPKGFEPLTPRFVGVAADCCARSHRNVPGCERTRQELTVAQATSDAADFSEGEVVLLAQILGLLVAFIGPPLTLRLINQLWPQLSFNDADFSKTANNEEAK